MNKTQYEGIMLNFEPRQVVIDAKSVPLNRREFDIFSLLTERGGELISRETLLNHLHIPSERADRVIDSHISHIRAKFRKFGIQTVKISSIYGHGYRLEYRKHLLTATP